MASDPSGVDCAGWYRAGADSRTDCATLDARMSGHSCLMRTAAIDPQVVDDRYGRLAASVIQRAILDGQTPGAHQASALAFLADRVSLGGWCAVAAVDVDIVRKRLID